jgi:hypothetical protein
MKDKLPINESDGWLYARQQTQFCILSHEIDDQASPSTIIIDTRCEEITPNQGLRGLIMRTSSCQVEHHHQNQGHCAYKNTKFLNTYVVNECIYKEMIYKLPSG